MSESEIMTSEELRMWAIIAAEAVGIPADEVSIIENGEDPNLPAVEIGDTAVALVPVNIHKLAQDNPPEMVLQWATGDETYESLQEALAEAVSEDAFERAASALRDAGLAQDA